MDKQRKRKIGFIIRKNNKKVDVSVCNAILPSEIVAEFQEKSKVIFELRPTLIAFNCLTLNYEELVTTISKRNFDIDSIYEEGIAVFSSASQRILNFLSSASSYLTITEKGVEKIYGESSAELDGWRNARKNLHSENFSYRLSYELRNYSQHYGLPISSTKIDLKDLHKSKPKHEIKILLDAEKLIVSGYNWKKLKAEVADLKTPIDVISLCSQYMYHLRKLRNEFFNLIDKQIQELESFIGKLSFTYKIPEDSTPVIFLCDSDKSITAPTQQEHFPIEEMKLLKLQRLQNEKLINDFVITEYR